MLLRREAVRALAGVEGRLLHPVPDRLGRGLKLAPELLGRSAMPDQLDHEVAAMVRSVKTSHLWSGKNHLLATSLAIPEISARDSADFPGWWPATHAGRQLAPAECVGVGGGILWSVRLWEGGPLSLGAGERSVPE